MRAITQWSRSMDVLYKEQLLVVLLHEKQLHEESEVPPPEHGGGWFSPRHLFAGADMHRLRCSGVKSWCFVMVLGSRE